MKIAVVTGSSRGIGEAFTASLLESGYLVYGGSRTESRINHPNFIDIELDVRSKKSVDSFFDEIAQKTEVVDVLVNNAGICEMSTLRETGEKEFLNNFTTNAFGSMLVFQAFEEFIIEEETRVFNILSSAYRELNEGTLAYSSAEGAKYSLSQVIKKEWSKYKISFIDLILPGVNTQIWDDYDNIDSDLLMSLEELQTFFSDLLDMKSGPKISHLELTL